MTIKGMRVEVGNEAIGLLPVAAVCLVVLAVILWREKHSLSYLLCFAIFSIYLLFAVDKAFFPIAISGDYADTMRDVPFTPFINLVPFNFNFSEMPHLVYLQIVQNIVLTVPFGFGVSFLARFRYWLIPAIGLGIELTQLGIALMLGYPYRVIDINDAILNAFGVLIGYGMFRIFAWLYLRVTQRFASKHRGLTAYIYDVARRAHMETS